MRAYDAVGLYGESFPLDVSGVDATPPTAPTELKISGPLTQRDVLLGWLNSSDSVGVTGYKVFQDGVEIASVLPGAGSTIPLLSTFYSVTGLTPYTSYTFTVKAFDAAGNLSSPSLPLSLKTLVDPVTVGDGGPSVSATLGADGFPAMAYTYLPSQDIRFTKCRNASCSDRNTVTFTIPGEDFNGTLDLAIGSDGLPAILFQNQSPISQVLYLIKCSDPECQTWNKRSVANFAETNSFSMTIDRGDPGSFPLIAWVDINTDISVWHKPRFMKCIEATCQSASTQSPFQSIQTINDVGYAIGVDDISVGSDGKPAILYSSRPTQLDTNISSIKFIKCFTATCSSFSSPIFIPNNESKIFDGRIGIPPDLRPVITYWEFSALPPLLRLARCSDASCTGAVPPAPPFFRTSSKFSSIGFGNDGFPMVAFTHRTATYNDLFFFKCVDAPCFIPVADVYLDFPGDAGLSPSLVVPSDGFPFISYIANVGTQSSFIYKLKFVKCMSATCQ